MGVKGGYTRLEFRVGYEDSWGFCGTDVSQGRGLGGLVRLILGQKLTMRLNL